MDLKSIIQVVDCVTERVSDWWLELQAFSLLLKLWLEEQTQSPIFKPWLEYQAFTRQWAVVVWSCIFFYLDPLQKTGYCQGKEVKHWDECHTCDEKRGEGKGKIKHRPKDEKWTSKPVFICLSAKKESACIVTSRYPGFVGGLSKKKAWWYCTTAARYYKVCNWNGFFIGISVIQFLSV